MEPLLVEIHNVHNATPQALAAIAKDLHRLLQEHGFNRSHSPFDHHGLFVSYNLAPRPPTSIESQDDIFVSFDTRPRRTH